jgi:hypothetical protein
MNITTELLQASINEVIKKWIHAAMYSGVEYTPSEDGTGSKYVTLPIKNLRTPIGADRMIFRGQNKSVKADSDKAYISFQCGDAFIYKGGFFGIRDRQHLDQSVETVFLRASHKAYDTTDKSLHENILTLEDIQESFKTYIPHDINWAVEFERIDENNSEYKIPSDSTIQTVPKSKSVRIHGWCLQSKESSIELVFSDDTSQKFPIPDADALKAFLSKYVGWKTAREGTGKLQSMDLQQQVDEINEKIDRIMEELKRLSSR